MIRTGPESKGTEPVFSRIRAMLWEMFCCWENLSPGIRMNVTLTRITWVRYEERDMEIKVSRCWVTDSVELTGLFFFPQNSNNQTDNKGNREWMLFVGVVMATESR